ncbi:MAG: hypothetical protein ACRD8O_24630 [Bryobacteraceae bacterium]
MDKRSCDNMTDDTVKLVKWTIVFTKPDEEVFLQEGRDIVNYRAMTGQFSGQKMAIFMGGAQSGLIPLDPALREKILNPLNFRYLNVTIEVEDRFPKQDGEYERRQAQAVESIGRKLGAAIP